MLKRCSLYTNIEKNLKTSKGLIRREELCDQHLRHFIKSLVTIAGNMRCDYNIWLVQ